MKVLTEVWCVDPDADAKNEALGSKVYGDGNSWLSYGFEVLDIRSIKEHGPHEFLDQHQATTITFHNGDTVTIRMAFREVWDLWNKASEDVVLMGKPVDQLTNQELNAMGQVSHGPIWPNIDDNDPHAQPSELHWAIKIRRLLLLALPLDTDAGLVIAERVGNHNAILRDITAVMELAYTTSGRVKDVQQRMELMRIVDRLFETYIAQPRA